MIILLSLFQENYPGSVTVRSHCKTAENLSIRLGKDYKSLVDIGLD